jgi:TetR/AcrR family transcriptional repressor of bet genes
MPGQKAPQHARREQILEAAMRVALKRRFAGLTIRDVAKEARLSNGLVLFHFKTRDALLNELLDWLLESSAVLRPAPEPVDAVAAEASLCALVCAEALRLSSDRHRAELFFDFWVSGTRTVGLRTQMRRALTNYRAEFRARAEALLRDADCGVVTPDGLAAAAVSFVQGCAIQAVIDPDSFDVHATLSAVNLLGRRMRQDPAMAQTSRQPPRLARHRLKPRRRA